MRRIKEIFKDRKTLLPVIVQDYKTKKVLMLAYMNRDAFELSIKTKKTHFYSRKMGRIWQKGEVSGNIQLIKKIFIDCDNDTLLIEVKQKMAACHKGYRTCFYRQLTEKGAKIVEKRIFNPKEIYKKI